MVFKHVTVDIFAKGNIFKLSGSKWSIFTVSILGETFFYFFFFYWNSCNNNKGKQKNE